MTSSVLMMARADEHLRAAERCLSDDLLNPAYELARTAAELYGKAILLRATGSFPRDHNVAGALQHRRLVPPEVSPAKLSRLLDDYTRGGYGFEQPAEAREVRAALDMARALERAAREDA